jgi:MATE family multidrug resistance protein
VYLFATLAFFCRPSVVGPFATRRVPPVWREIRRILRTGVPIGGQWWLEMTSFAAFSTLVVRMGDAPMAASQAFILLLSLSFMQAIGLSIAVTTLVGRYIGAEDLASAERSFRAGLVLAMILAVGIALLFVSVPGPLIRLFSDDAEVIALARPLLLMGAFYQLFDAIAIMSDGALHGAGDTRWPFVARLLLSWGLFLPLAYAIGFTLEGGLTGAWLGGLVYVAVLAATLFLRFRSRAWQAIEI